MSQTIKMFIERNKFSIIVGNHNVFIAITDVQTFIVSKTLQ